MSAETTFYLLCDECGLSMAHAATRLVGLVLVDIYRCDSCDMLEAVDRSAAELRSNVQWLFPRRNAVESFAEFCARTDWDRPAGQRN